MQHLNDHDDYLTVGQVQHWGTWARGGRHVGVATRVLAAIARMHPRRMHLQRMPPFARRPPRRHSGRAIRTRMLSTSE
jgi:hypothetical protein